MASTSSVIYPVGAGVPPNCGASDGVGDTEAKSVVARFDVATGNFSGCQAVNFFPYRGGEGYNAALVDGSFLYITGTAETCGFGNHTFILAKYDLAGNLLDKVAEPGINFGGFTCIGGSYGQGVTALNGNFYVAGTSKLTSEDGIYRPVLMRYSPSLTRDWKRRPTDNSGGGFLGAVAFGGAMYAVGSVGSPNSDYLIEKYDEMGNRIWTKTSGGAGQDVLNSIAAVGNRLFAVGSTTSQGSGGADAVVLEIDPTTGDTLSTVTYGGALNDAAFAAGTDGIDLYVVGESRSFASPEGNLVGQSDSMLLRYTLAPADTTPPVITPTITGTIGANGWYTSNVSVAWSVTDPESGVASSSGCETRTLTQDTSGTTLTCSATNGVGLSNSVSATIKIDKTGPQISGLPAPGCTLWPANHKLVQVGVVTASEIASGLASFSVTATSNEPENGLGDGDAAPDIVITGSGLGPRTIQLRAERSGTGNGRVYSITATANDVAGNAVVVRATCAVPHDQRGQ
ncbi:MAG: hypothetical protein ACKV22_16210 [Bryobacteraceae bacterium]